MKYKKGGKVSVGRKEEGKGGREGEEEGDGGRRPGERKGGREKQRCITGPSWPMSSQSAPFSVILTKSESVTCMRGRKSYKTRAFARSEMKLQVRATRCMNYISGITCICSKKNVFFLKPI